VPVDHLNETIRRHLDAHEPAISVDTKKKELVGVYKNGGVSYARRAIMRAPIRRGRAFWMRNLRACIWGPLVFQGKRNHTIHPTGTAR
jgi:hypothetical protein